MKAIFVPPGFQAVDQAVANSTVFVDSMYLRWPVEANTQYIYKSMIIQESDPEARFRYRIGRPTGTVMASDASDADVVNTPDSTEIIIQPDATFPHRGRGLIDVGVTSGEVWIQFAQAVPHPSMTVLKAGSWIQLTRVTDEVSP